MNEETKFSLDDPRLTAYALGELDGEDRRLIEAWLLRDPKARAALDWTRRLAAQLEHSLADEPIMAAPEPEILEDRPPSGWIRSPWGPYLAAGLAAGLALMLVFHPGRGPAAPESLQAVDLRPVPTGTPSAAAGPSVADTAALPPAEALTSGAAASPEADANAPALIRLSPFAVEASKDQGYFRAKTIAGAWANTEIGALPSSIAAAARLQEAAVNLKSVAGHAFTDQGGAPPQNRPADSFQERHFDLMFRADLDGRPAGINPLDSFGMARRVMVGRLRSHSPLFNNAIPWDYWIPSAWAALEVTANPFGEPSLSPPFFGGDFFTLHDHGWAQAVLFGPWSLNPAAAQPPLSGSGALGGAVGSLFGADKLIHPGTAQRAVGSGAASSVHPAAPGTRSPTVPGAAH